MVVKRWHCVCLIVEDEMDTEDLTLCCLCEKLMTNPVWLPCLDAFCEACLVGRSSCPKCWKVFKKSHKDVTKYKDKFLTRMVEMKSVSSVMDAKDRCEFCKVLPNNQSFADFYCMDCHKNLCADCQCRHRQIPFTGNHKVVKFGTELSDKVFQDMRRRRPSCFVHQRIKPTWRCYQCGLYVCSKCQRNHHTNHRIQTVNKLLHYSRQHIADAITGVKETTSSITAALSMKKIRNKMENKLVKGQCEP